MAGMSEPEAVGWITARMTRPPSPANEVQSAVSKAYGTPRSTIPVTGPTCTRAHTIPITEVRYDPARLLQATAKIESRNWRRWLWERSPKRPEAMNAYSFLSSLYRAGETVLIFDRLDSKAPLATVQVTEPMDCRVPDIIRAGGRYGSGIWYLANPVDGRWHDTGERDSQGKAIMSCRSQHAVTSWRYAVLESDQAPADRWIAFVATLPIKAAAIYSSGGRSVHTLVRLDAGSKEEWDSIIGPLKRPFKVLGVDAGALSGVRLTRLPGCWRPEKGGYQKLLYLHPDPPLCRLLDLPVPHSRPWTLTHWRTTCLRWNCAQEAFQ